MRDYVYIFENEWMPGLVKIGITDNLKARVSNSGNYTYVPCRFKCVCAIKAEGRAEDIENFIKEQYAEFKIGYREFYKMSVDRAKSLLKSMAKLCNGELVSQQEIDDANNETNEGDSKHKRQPNKTFGTLGIPVGSELTFYKNDKIVCTTTDMINEVNCEGELSSISGLAVKILNCSANGFNCFKYRGTILSDL